jgi:hypothetical protein
VSVLKTSLSIVFEEKYTLCFSPFVRLYIFFKCCAQQISLKIYFYNKKYSIALGNIK